MNDKKTATCEDAQLLLRLYETRREEKMREARSWFQAEFLPNSADDVKAIWFDGKHQNNAKFRMVTSYWDMAASFVTLGALNAELFLASSTEMLMVWAKLEDSIEELRHQSGLIDYLAHVEALAKHPAAQLRLEWLRQRVATLREQRASG